MRTTGVCWDSIFLLSRSRLWTSCPPISYASSFVALWFAPVHVCTVFLFSLFLGRCCCRRCAEVRHMFPAQPAATAVAATVLLLLFGVATVASTVNTTCVVLKASAPRTTPMRYYQVSVVAGSATHASCMRLLLSIFSALLSLVWGRHVPTCQRHRSRRRPICLQFCHREETGRR